MFNVFVYGTLKKNRGNYHYLKSSEFIGNGKVENYTMVSLGGFPGAIDTGEDIIHGEVYRINENTLNNLDRLEGYNVAKDDYNFYTRETVDVTMEDGSIISAYMYTLPKSYLKYETVENGNW